MRALAAGTMAAALVLTPSAHAVTEIGANGNVFTGGLSFTPGEVTVPVGEVVRWRNTDSFVPHTSTEKHDLWDLTGDYGATPASPAGYGPGATVERPFEAGSHRYYCRVHPRDMTGTVAVPVTLSKEVERVRLKRRHPGKRRRKRLTFIVATWAVAPPAPGLVFDVERRVGVATPWRPLRTGTRDQSVRFRAGIRGTPWQIRARLRRDGSQDLATDWSPVAGITG
jgi:plastocyanin